MRALTCLALAGAMWLEGRGQTLSDDADALVSLLQNYLIAYERELSTVVAEERYRQSETSFRAESRETAQDVILRTRTLESEVAFLRLPGNREWFGVRNVRRVNGRPVKTAHQLRDTLMAAGSNLDTAIQAIVKASSTHNLGTARTINMPTVPLEVLHPRNRQRVSFNLRGRETVAGTATRELEFREQGDGGLVRDQDSRPMLARGSVWVDATGRVWRVTLQLAHAYNAARNVRTADNELRVEFAFNPELKLLLPRDMHEEFVTGGGGQFKGRATYSGFRRFTTSGRIIPQP